MKINIHNQLRRVSVVLALGSVLATTALADMYRLGNNYAPGTAGPYNSGGGVPAQPIITSQTITSTNATLCWYGTMGWYAIQGSTDLVTWAQMGDTVAATDFAWNQTIANSLGLSGSFRLAVNNSYAGQGACSGCHGAVYTPWSQTAHASALSALASYGQDNNPECLLCHTVGYGQPTGYTNQTLTPNLANVGCENCHGPAGWHKNSDHALIRPAKSIDPAICGSCHHGYNPQYDEYMTSLHSQVNDDIKYGGNSGIFYTNDITISNKGGLWLSHGYYQSTNSTTGVVSTNPATGIINSTNPITGYDRATSCGMCHSGAMRLAMMNDYEARQTGTTNPVVLPTPNDAGAWGPTCAVCHDPHSTRQFLSGYILQITTNIVAGVSTNKVTNSVPIVQTLQFRNPTWSSNFYTIPSVSDKRYDTSGNPYYMGTTFASMYDPNVNLCGQCHNTRGARWDGRSYGLMTNTVISGPLTNTVYVNIYTTNTVTQVFTNSLGQPYLTNTYTSVYISGRYTTNVVSTLTNQVISVGLTTNVTGFSRPPHNSVQYNILIGILQPDYLNTTNTTSVWTNSVLTNGLGIYATHSGIRPRTSQMNTNQCATCHVPEYSTGSGNVSGHSFEMNIHNCTLCHGSVPTWAVTQAATTNSIRNVVTLLNQWALDKAPALFSAADYNKSKMNIWEYTTIGALACITNTGPATTNQLKLPTAILQARFNAYMVRNDGSLGVHNPKFIPLLLSDAEGKVLSQYPVAAFTANTVIVTNGSSVVFSNWVSGLTSYSWNFGDGNTSTSASPTNVYSAGNGTYTVTFTGTNSLGVGETLVRSNYITVASLPVASFTATTTSGTRPFTVNFSSTSTGALSYRWQIFTNTTTGYIYVSDATDTSFTYGTNLFTGSYKVILRASNAAGNTTATNTITVN